MSEHKLLDWWFLVNSEETFLKYVVKSKNLAKESIKNKEFRKKVLKEKLKARWAMATS